MIPLLKGTSLKRHINSYAIYNFTFISVLLVLEFLQVGTSIVPLSRSNKVMRKDKYKMNKNYTSSNQSRLIGSITDINASNHIEVRANFKISYINPKLCNLYRHCSARK